MFEKTIENIVNDLIQIDIDAFFAYEEAIKHIEEKDISDQLKIFQTDHRSHFNALSHALKKSGGTPLEFNQDMKGKLIQGMTWLQGMLGTKGALEAMTKNEELTNKKYKAALAHTGFTEELKNLIKKNFEDEKKHLAYVVQKKQEF